LENRLLKKQDLEPLHRGRLDSLDAASATSEARMMTLSEAKKIADRPEGHTDAQLRRALDRLASTLRNGGLRKSEIAASRLSRRLSRLNIAITSNLIRTDV
jgi:hypothetical protein